MEFRDFVHLLDGEGRLTHVERPISRDYEVAKYLKKNDGKPLIFENVTGSKMQMPVVGNALSSMDLLCKGLGIPKEKWIEYIDKAIENPKSAESGSPDFEYYEPDLDLLPILKHYPLDFGAYITSGIVFAERNGVKNISFHRLAKISDDRLVGRLVEKRDLHSMYVDAKEHGEDVEIAIAIGNNIGVMVAAATTVGSDFYELGIAAALEDGIKVTRAKTNHIEYPISSEIVLEGRILHDETSKEGPFVDLTETYDIVREQPVFAIEKIAMRKNPIYQALLPGGNEHKILMGAPRTPTIYKAIKESGVDVAAVYLTEGGSGWLDAAIAIKKKSEEDPKKAIEAAIKGHKSLKKITIVDDDIDVTNPNEVNYAITMYWTAGKERIFSNVKGSSLDPMATSDGIGSKLAIDATKPLDVPKEKMLKMRKASIEKVDI
ncbi:MAG: UbiD family decarboxylase [Candidatus Micrarchaeaceae archaeon]